MRNKEKILKQNSLCSGINIKIVVVVVGLTLIIGFISTSGASFSALVGVWLGYKLLKLFFRVLGLVFSLVLSLVSIGVIMVIVSLLIF